MNLERIQQALRQAGIDGWLFYDFHNRDPISYRILGLPSDKFTSRRWFYFIPANGSPVKLVHRVEPTKLDQLPGEKKYYSAWRQLHQMLREILQGVRRVAMQYSPLAAVPYVATVDAGTVELIRSFGAEIVSSANLVQTFEALLDERAFQTHQQAGFIIQNIKDEAFLQIGNFIREGKKLTEYDLQQWIMERFEQQELTCMGEFPIVAVNEHAANPHYEPTVKSSAAFRPGDMVLIDLWAKLKKAGAIFYDITWCGYVGDKTPEEYNKLFQLVRRARQTALKLVEEKMSRREQLHGYEVDDVCRAVIEQAGYGEYFVHRTGHSIGEEVHANGANLDNLETCDDRLLMPGMCFSIEPGIYLEGRMGVRTEINVFIQQDYRVTVVGAQQEELVLIR